MDNNIIGERIQRRRTELGLSLRDLAKKINVSSSYLSTIERGKTKPSLEKLNELSRGLNCPVIWLIGEEKVLKKINVLDTGAGGQLYDFILNKHQFPNGLTYNEMESKLKALEEKTNKNEELEGIIDRLKTVIFDTKDNEKQNRKG